MDFFSKVSNKKVWTEVKLHIESINFYVNIDTVDDSDAENLLKIINDGNKSYLFRL
jgi:hypothetical protein